MASENIVTKEWEDYRRNVLREVADGSVQLDECRKLWYSAWLTCLDWLSGTVSAQSDDDGAAMLEAALVECRTWILNYVQSALQARRD